MSHIYYSKLSVGQESMDNLAWFSGSEYLTSQQTRWLVPKVKVTSRFHWDRMYFQAYLEVVGRFQLFKDCWTKGLSSSLAVDQRMLSPPCHMGFSIDQLKIWKLAGFIKVSKWKRTRDMECVNTIEVTVFYDLISEVTFLFLLVFCWLEADTRSSPQTKGVEYTREGDSTRVWIPESSYHWRGWGKSYKATYHNCPVLGM